MVLTGNSGHRLVIQPVLMMVSVGAHSLGVAWAESTAVKWFAWRYLGSYPCGPAFDHQQIHPPKGLTVWRKPEHGMKS